MNYAVTAKVGNNDDLFPDILRLYVPRGSLVADVTWGRGIFWKQVDQDDYRIIRSDIERCGDVQCNFRALPHPAASLDAVILDPPYLYIGGWKTLRGYFHETTHDWENTSYGNVERASRGISGVKAVDQMYYEGIQEAARVLRKGGILILKCMDQVQSGKQQWAHIVYLRFGEEVGFMSEDLFVLVRKSRPLMRHKPENQKHARRNHSYFLVMRRKT